MRASCSSPMGPKNDAGAPAGTSVALTGSGRQALDQYTAALRGILDGV